MEGLCRILYLDIDEEGLVQYFVLSFFLCLFYIFSFICFNFNLVAGAIFLIGVDVLVECLVLDGC